MAAENKSAKTVTIYKVSLPRKEIIYLPGDKFESSVNKSGKLEYFIKGKGWQKTTKFIEEEIEISSNTEDRRAAYKTFMKYGTHVTCGNFCKDTCTYMQKQVLQGWISICSILDKANLLEECPDQLLNILCAEYYSACFGLFMFDIVETDKKLSKLHPEYNSVDCTLGGKQRVTMEDAVQHFYGDVGLKVIEALIGSVAPKKPAPAPVEPSAQETIQFPEN